MVVLLSFVSLITPQLNPPWPVEENLGENMMTNYWINQLYWERRDLCHLSSHFYWSQNHLFLCDQINPNVSCKLKVVWQNAGGKEWVMHVWRIIHEWWRVETPEKKRNTWPGANSKKIVTTVWKPHSDPAKWMQLLFCTGFYSVHTTIMRDEFPKKARFPIVRDPLPWYRSIGGDELSESLLTSFMVVLLQHRKSPCVTNMLIYPQN